MQQSRVIKYEKSKNDGALRQGEILSKVVQISIPPDSINSTSIKLTRVTHHYAIVVTPDCDLEWDFEAQQGNANKRKILPNILLCTAMYSSDLAKRINEDRPLNRKFEKSTIWKRAIQNKEERYHFLEKISLSLDLQGEGIQPLGVDFKEYFTMPTVFLYSSIDDGLTLRRCRLKSPYCEHLNSRFAYFQSRIGLPEDHQYSKGEIYLETGNPSTFGK